MSEGKKGWKLVAGIGLGGVAMLVLAVGMAYGAFSAGRAHRTASTSTSHTVVYEADASGARGARTGSITLQSADGGTQQSEVSLPLRTKLGGTGLTFQGFKSGDFVYLSVQNGDDAGSVTCRILVDGVKISENTSSGGHTIATCSSRVP